jgi:CBS domain-containing protein
VKVRDFIRLKDQKPITIGQGETVQTAIKILVEKNIGALPVVDSEDKLVGIISERDLLKECLDNSSNIGLKQVQEIMTRYVAIATPDEDLDYATSVMKQKGIRHLPVVVNFKVTGMISMRDIVNTRLHDIQAEVSYIGLLQHHSQHRLM